MKPTQAEIEQMEDDLCAAVDNTIAAEQKRDDCESDGWSDLTSRAREGVYQRTDQAFLRCEAKLREAYEEIDA